MNTALNTHLSLHRDPLDDMLKTDAQQQRNGYIDDNGFTLRVIDALPARRSLSPAIRFGIPFGLAVLAGLIVVTFTGGGNFLIDAMMDVVTRSATVASFVFLVLVAALYTLTALAASDN